MAPSRGSCREAEGVAFNTHRVHLCCGKLPVRCAERFVSSSCCAAAEGNSLSLAPAARASSLAREPLFVPPGQMGQGKEAFGRKDFPTTWISSVHGSLARELPKAEGVAFRRSATRRRNHPCGTKNFLWVSCNTPAPVRIESNSLSLAPAARASSLEREPFSRIAGVAREDKKTAAEKNFPTT